MPMRALDLSSGFKRCPKCEAEKPLAEFYKSTKTRHGYSVYCKSCTARRHEKWRRKNLAKVAKASKKWRRENPRLSKDHVLRSTYGIPIGTYDRMLDAQQGKCAICGTTDAGGRGDFHIDHCHDTKRIRGLLCHGCNVGIGNLGHSVDRLSSAIRYLTEGRGES